jgi:hypothetical protein
MVYINDQHRFIFIENPKSGSTCILKALEKSLKNSINRPGPSKAHLTCEQIKQQFPDKWRDYLKVTTFREPFQRFCSSIRFKEHVTYYYKTEKDILYHMEKNKNCVYCLPQEHFTNGCDIVLNLDTLQTDFDNLCNVLGIETTKIKSVNKSDVKNSSCKIPIDTLTKIFKKV